MSLISDAAHAALSTAKTDFTQSARTSLGETLTPLQVSKLTVAYVDVSIPLVIFTDGTTSLAWRDSGVWIAEKQDDEWTMLAQVSNLSAVGTWLKSRERIAKPRAKAKA